jgi:hypothetical protein
MTETNPSVPNTSISIRMSLELILATYENISNTILNTALHKSGGALFNPGERLALHDIRVSISVSEYSLSLSMLHFG